MVTNIVKCALVGVIWLGIADVRVQAQRGVGNPQGLARQGQQPEIITISGTVQQVISQPCEATTGRSSMGSHMLVKTSEGQELNIHLGPASEVAIVTEKLAAGKQVTAKVFRTDDHAENHYVAQSVEIDDHVIGLRGESLRPVWAGGGSGSAAANRNNRPGRGGGAGWQRGGGPGWQRGGGPGWQRGGGPGWQRGGGPGWQRGGGAGEFGGRGRGCAAAGTGRNLNCAAGPLLSNLDPIELSADETERILKLREEEKLAHDVYVTLGKQWNVPVFDNIAQAEAMHMRVMERLVQALELTDPVTDTKVGKFPSSEMTKLYQQLVEQGSESLIAAYKVGARIEEMDIADLRQARKTMSAPAVLTVYDNLERASRNHLRAFASHLLAADQEYEAQHLSQDEFDAIASSDRERGGASMANRGGRGGRGRGWSADDERGAGQGLRNGAGRGRGRGRGRQ